MMIKPLVIAVGLTMSVMANAQSSQEVEQLRQEVQQLKALVHQYAQQNQTVQANLNQLANTAVQPPVAQKASTEKRGLGMTLGNAEFNLYGNVRMDGSYQVEGSSRDLPYNHINAVALEGNNESSDRLRSTLSATRLGLDFKSPVGDQDVKGKIEVDFLGGSNFDNLRIRHAYLNYGNWLIGQTWSNFAVPDYMPETVDALAYAGGAVKRTPQVRYTAKFSPQTNLVVAAEDPKDNSITQRLPALTARLNHQFADNMSVSARAMGHEKRINSDEEMAWGVGLGAKYDVTPSTTLKADYYHVKGDSSFVSFANTGTIQGANGLEQSEFDSITVGLTQKFNEKLRGTVGYGYMSFDQDADYLAATPADKRTGVNKDLWQAWANVFYSPIKPVSLGLEYVYGEREAVVPAANGSKTGEDNRINMVAIYNF
ncbi:MAG: DcaP family trimeric outer membrane transporter [Acinetobacter sp.]|nr:MULTISPECIES: DcaP family trimeric outer membrane transporter [Acinetobacter]MCO8101809.1 DcaP family trimeric outer membrane transporter [Acinetobacter indicus]MCO8108407.1 DcaP family trimeric outer membrane transporter [Acinetobacter indicus]MDO4578819.1 DcaP family trimeric outer membrane transporter [Acinetobacter sp.]